MDQELTEALIKQLNQELQNAYTYLAMAAFMDYKGFSGFAHFFKVQAREELEHAMKIYEFLNARGVRVVLHNVPAPKQEWNDIVSVVGDFYNFEKENTRRIWNLVDLARKNGDKACESFLKWFVDEQVEEEKSAMELLTKVEMVKDNIAGLLMLDRVLAERK